MYKYHHNKFLPLSTAISSDTFKFSTFDISATNCKKMQSEILKKLILITMHTQCRSTDHIGLPLWPHLYQRLATVYSKHIENQLNCDLLVDLQWYLSCRSRAGLNPHHVIAPNPSTMTVSKDEKAENFLVETFNPVRHFNVLCSLRTGYQNSSSHAHMKPQCFQDGGCCKSELGNSATICLGKGFIRRKSFFSLSL